MALSLSALQALRSAAETGSFAAAARRLRVTQSNVSQHVRGLEQDYSVRLFTRSNGQLVATPLCTRICDAAERMLHEHDALERMLCNHGSLQSGALSVGLGNAMPGMSLIAAFQRNFPDVRIRVETGSFRTIMRAVMDHRVDVGVLPDIPADRRFRRQVLSANRVVAIAAPDHALASLSQVTGARLGSERLVFRSEGSSTQKIVDRYFRTHNLAPSPFLTLDSRDGVFEAVANGMGVGFVWATSSGRRDDLVRIELSGGETRSEEVVFAPVDREMPTLDAFLSLAAKYGQG